MSGEKFQYQCQCGQVSEATPDMIGTRVTCSACNTDLIVPSPRSAAAQPSATAQNIQAPAKSSSKALGWALGICAVLVVGLAVTLIIVMTGGEDVKTTPAGGETAKAGAQDDSSGGTGSGTPGGGSATGAGGGTGTGSGTPGETSVDAKQIQQDWKTKKEEETKKKEEEVNEQLKKGEVSQKVKDAVKAALQRGASVVEIRALLSLGKENELTDDEIVDYITALKSQSDTTVVERPATPTETTPELSAMVQKVLPSVVTIFNEAGSGSGFIVDSEKRLIITNRHVIAGGGQIIVRIHFPSGAVDVADTEVVRIHKKTDLALIRITSEIDLPPHLEIADSADCVVTEVVIAIGSPGSGYREVEEGVLEQTVTKGIISAKDRNFATHKCLQIDAAISPGNSGGPLFNKHGKVVGVNTFGLNTDRRESLNFAIYTEFVMELIAGDEASLSREEIAAVVINPAELNFQKGCQSIQDEQYWAAIDYFKKAIEKKPDYAEAYMGLGVCYASLDKFDVAVKAFDLAIKYDPDSVAAYRYRGWAYMSLEDYPMAVADFAKARALLPDEPVITRELAIAYNDWGVKFLSEDQNEKAKAMFDLALKVEPGYAVALANRAIVFLRENDVVSAMVDLNDAIKSDGQYAFAYYLRAQIYYARDDYSLAIFDYEKAYSLDPDIEGLPAELARAYNDQGVAYYENGDFENAITYFSEAIRWLPNTALYYRNRSASYTARNKPGDQQRAAADNAKAEQLDPQGG